MAAARHIFWLLCCGETTWSREGRIRGRTDLPLSSSGRSAISADVVRLAGASIGTVYHPGDEAATESATVVAEATRARLRSIDDLADPDLGLLEGLTEQTFAERYGKRYKSWREDPLALTPPDGESLAHARARIFEAVARALKRSRGAEPLFVLHQLALGMLQCWLADRPTSALWSMIRDHPRLERYAIAADQLEALDAAAREAVGEAG